MNINNTQELKTTQNYKRQKSTEQKRKDDISLLKSYYPNYEVKGMLKNYKVYQRMKQHSRIEKMTIGNYIESLGFTYIVRKDSGKKVKLNIYEKDILLLRELYPDEKVTNLSWQKALYRKIYRHAEKKEMSVEGYIKYLGFQKG